MSRSPITIPRRGSAGRSPTTWLALAGGVVTVTVASLALLRPPAPEEGALPAAPSGLPPAVSADPASVGRQADPLTGTPVARAPTRLSPASLDDPDDAPRATPVGPPRSDREHQAELMRLAEHRGQDALLQAATARLEDEQASHAAKVAALRALQEADSPQAVPVLERVLVGPAAPTRGPLDLPTWAVRSLTERAAHDPAAREALRRLVEGETTARDPALRRRAATALARWAPAEELPRLAATLVRDGDPLLAASVRDGLSRRPDAAGRWDLFAGILPPVALAAPPEEEP